MLSMSNMGDQVWLITSRQTEPDLKCALVSWLFSIHVVAHVADGFVRGPLDSLCSSIFLGGEQLIYVWVVDLIHKTDTR